MKFFKKIALFTVSVLTMCFTIKSVARAYPTPVFDKLTPNLQKIMRLYGEDFLYGYSSSKTPEEVAEDELNSYHVEIDGNLYKGHGGPMKLTNEDIESLYNLPNVKQLDLERFDLKDVDMNKFLRINNNKTIEIVYFDHCFFDTFDRKQVAARITNEDYTVGISPCLWIAWPGVDPDEIFNGR